MEDESTMSRNIAQLRQPVSEFRGKPRSGDTMVVELIEEQELKAHPVLKSYYKELKDALRAVLGDLFAAIEVKLDKRNQTVTVEILQEIDGLREELVIHCNRTMKGYSCLEFDAIALQVRLSRT